MSIYQRILTKYWRQYYPNYQFPKGFVVHHIIPRCEGGTDDPKNLIALHPDDHATIHRCRGDKVSEKFILIGNYWDEEKRESARKRATGVKQSKETIQKRMRYGEEHHWYGKTFSEQHRKKLSNSHKGKKLSKDHRDAIRSKLSGRVRTDTERQAISKAKKGKSNGREGYKHQSNTLQKMRESTKSRPQVECPHCNKIGQYNSMVRWHLDNCKYK